MGAKMEYSKNSGLLVHPQSEPRPLNVPSRLDHHKKCSEVQDGIQIQRLRLNTMGAVAKTLYLWRFGCVG